MLMTTELDTAKELESGGFLLIALPSLLFEGLFHEIHETGYTTGYEYHVMFTFKIHCMSSQGICKIPDHLSTFHGSYCASLSLQLFCRS